MADELPLYDQGTGLELNTTAPSKPLKANAGLWFERFFNQYEWGKNDKTGKTEYRVKGTDASNGKTGKQRWIDSVNGGSGDSQELKHASNQLAWLAQQCHGTSAVFDTDWHFVTGLGNPHPVENGMTWHPTLGVPYLPGSAVKGLVRAWVSQWEDNAESGGIDNDERKRRLREWFGSETKKPEDEQQVGGFIFFDALPVKPPKLTTDIVNPHMGHWYEQGDTHPDTVDTRPADWHEPNPNFFLVVKHASFRFAIAPRPGAFGASEQTELEKVFESLSNALIWMGAGAKTAKGYGGMARVDNTRDHKLAAGSFTDNLLAIQDERTQAAAQAKITQAYEGVDRALFRRSAEDDWPNDKQAFLKPGELENWFEKLEGTAHPDVIEHLTQLFEVHMTELLANPDKIRGKKQKPVFSERQKQLANSLKALKSKLG